MNAGPSPCAQRFCRGEPLIGGRDIAPLACKTDRIDAKGAHRDLAGAGRISEVRPEAEKWRFPGERLMPEKGLEPPTRGL